MEWNVLCEDSCVLRRAEQEVGSLILTEGDIDSVPIDSIVLHTRKKLRNARAAPLYILGQELWSLVPVRAKTLPSPENEKNVIHFSLAN